MTRIEQIDAALALAIDRLWISDVDGEEAEHIATMQAAREALAQFSTSGWIVAYSINHGSNDITDHWTVHATENEARSNYDAAWALENVHCATVARMIDATEPHWLEGGI